MLRTSLLETTTTHADDAELVDGATDVIEAATAEAAIAQVHERLGPDARILEARRDLRGGIGGFFAKEVVQLHAAPGPGRSSSQSGEDVSDPAPPPPSTQDAPVDTTPEATSSPFDRLLADAPGTVDFATFLRERMVQGPGLGIADPSAEASPEPSPARAAADAAATDAAATDEQAIAAWRAATRPAAPSPATDGGSLPAVRPATSPATSNVSSAVPGAAPGGQGQAAGPAWSAQRLLQLGVPADLVRAVGLDQDADDLTWTTALAAELADACGPIPSGPALLVGPLADALKDLVGDPTARSQVWFDALRDGRWLHLVVGGEGWRDHLASAPRVVSWTRPQDLPAAVRCARELELTLGYGPVGGSIRRARPLDVALALRELVDER